jgi:hypothetical protein
VCPICSRRYRRRHISKPLRIGGGRIDARILTVYPDKVDAGHLKKTDLAKLHARQAEPY